MSKYETFGPSLLSTNSDLIFFSVLACTFQTENKETSGRKGCCYFSFSQAKQKTSSFHLESTSKQASLVQIKSFHMHVTSSAQKLQTFEVQISGFNSE